MERRNVAVAATHAGPASAHGDAGRRRQARLVSVAKRSSAFKIAGFSRFS
jgi:hypothetical protein